VPTLGQHTPRVGTLGYWLSPLRGLTSSSRKSGGVSAAIVSGGFGGPNSRSVAHWTAKKNTGVRNTQQADEGPRQSVRFFGFFACGVQYRQDSLTPIIKVKARKQGSPPVRSPDVLLSLLRHLLSPTPTPRHFPSRSSALRLELLEDRTALAAFRWIGGVSTSWQNSANWQEAVNGQYGAASRYPGETITQPGGVVTFNKDDDVAIENTASKTAVLVQRNCRLSIGQAITIKSLTFTSWQPAQCDPGVVIQTISLIIDSGSALFIEGANGNDMRLYMDGKETRLEINNGSAMHISNGSGIWNSPSITSSKTQATMSDGYIYLTGMEFTVGNLAEKLTATLNVVGSETKSSLLSWSSSGGTPLKKNVDIQDANINIFNDATLLLAHDDKSDTRGGLVNGSNSVINIEDGGQLTRVKDQLDTEDNIVYLTVAPKVVIKEGGTMEMKKHSSIYFGEGCQSAGTVKAKQGRLKAGPGKKVVLLGGSATFFADVNEIGKCRIDGLFEVMNATVTIGSNVLGVPATSFCTLVTTDNVIFGSGSQLRLSADASTEGRCDSLSVAGAVTVSSSNTALICLAVNSPSSWAGFNKNYTLISAASISGSWGTAGVLVDGYIYGGGYWYVFNSSQSILHLQGYGGGSPPSPPPPTYP
jgi:hypothetical protein